MTIRKCDYASEIETGWITKALSNFLESVGRFPIESKDILFHKINTMHIDFYCVSIGNQPGVKKEVSFFTK